MTGSITLREKPILSDRDKVFGLLTNAGFFLPREMAYGMRLFDDHLRRGESSPYQFVIAERGDSLVGFGCFSLRAYTDERYHLRWLTVDRSMQRTGLGRTLEEHIARSIRKQGGLRIYAEISNRDRHAPARRFYLGCGYTLAATLPDFYSDGDHQEIYVKDLRQATR